MIFSNRADPDIHQALKLNSDQFMIIFIQPEHD